MPFISSGWSGVANEEHRDDYWSAKTHLNGDTAATVASTAETTAVAPPAAPVAVAPVVQDDGDIDMAE